jgi:hypothetical protein
VISILSWDNAAVGSEASAAAPAPAAKSFLREKTVCMFFVRYSMFSNISDITACKRKTRQKGLVCSPPRRVTASAAP